MYIQYLNQIYSQSKLYGDEMQPPCSIDQIQSLEKRALSNLNAVIPKEYLYLLMLHNGLDWNGLVIYDSKPTAITGYPDRVISGFVEANHLRREITDWARFLIFGDSGDEDYCFDVQQSEYVIVDSVSIDILESFQSFDELMAEVLKQRI